MTEENPKQFHRPIRSFVLRQGRVTESQRRALEQHWENYGLSIADGMFEAETQFGRLAPLVLEIGFGNGRSLIEMMEHEPEKDFIGIEVHSPGVGSLISGAQQGGLRNLKVYREDAIEVLKQVIPDESLSRVQLFFPDPWHKKKHHKRRIVQPSFAALLRQKLKPGGIFHMATDWQNYAEHMREVMDVAPGYVNLAGAEGYIPRPSCRPLTKFEQRGHRLGHGVWDMMYERRD
ncbi:MAG: tRNA (guanosine(46)-N7)-methyltransferase TrmB [Pseudomonadales bacterium]|nr:tRNA (guanosine(46)-N7)-methyltransferase TrmB [Pseudomonadales bacterium]